ncbi:hypothetical protein ACN9MZ_26395 [Pseudoduganella sp. S-14]|uniref:hypothetical protein n=1 Tax=Pseudoduganella sp. S-14 TaxID=3404065 RepID=UPI003CEFA7A5
MKRLCLAMAAVLLAGCGGGGSDAASSMSISDPVPAPPPPADTFISALVALVRSALESTEPADVDGVALGQPDGGEPVALE